jgi:hypothetical protein
MTLLQVNTACTTAARAPDKVTGQESVLGTRTPLTATVSPLCIATRAVPTHAWMLPSHSSLLETHIRSTQKGRTVDLQTPKTWE